MEQIIFVENLIRYVAIGMVLFGLILFFLVMGKLARKADDHVDNIFKKEEEDQKNVRNN